MRAAHNQRSRKIKPTVTINRIEKALDALAAMIVDYGDRGRDLLSIYERLEKDLTAMRAEDALMASVRARVTQSADRTAVRS